LLLKDRWFASLDIDRMFLSSDGHGQTIYSPKEDPMKSKRTDTWWGRVIVAMVAVWLVSITGYAAEPVRIGVAGAHSGELAPYGISGLRGVKLALERIQTQGGILGRPIKIMVEDDLCKPKEAALVASKLVEGGVYAVIGHIAQ
jgi:ABC-type branched-subunit amino acid transport system substrate-binding protein